MKLLAAGIAALAALAIAGCTKSEIIDIAMSGADHEPSPRQLRVGPYEVLAGDMHCHVLPPDAPYHVSRQLASTFELAKKENLDFVVLTPHMPRRFFLDDNRYREWALESQAQLREGIVALHPDLIVIPGFEYTDYQYGHVGMSFADPNEVLKGLTGDELAARPELFFERWLAHGGFMTINHPVNVGLLQAPFQELRYDMSWRELRLGASAVPPEIDFITNHAAAIESYNTSITHLRDQFLLDDEDRSLRIVASLVDHESRRQQRKIAAVGGSDSHGEWLRATTFVLATDRSLPALREGLAHARTCVRGAEACTLQAHAHEDSRDAAWAVVGDSLTTTSDVLDVRAMGDSVSYIVNGAGVLAPNGQLPIPPGRCAVVRAIVGRSWSSGIYVNCGF